MRNVTRGARFALFIVALVCATTTTTHAAILSAGQVLQVFFTVAPAAPTPDVLTLNLGLVNVLAAHTSRTGALFDGNTLLGTGSTNSFGGHVGPLGLSPARSWRQATSLWNFDNPAVANFVPIQNGTNAGRIDFTIQTGAMDVNLNNISLGMGQAIAENIFINSVPQPVITAVQIVPEPAGLALLAAGAVLLARRFRR
jgi:hypothetical protein